MCAKTIYTCDMCGHAIPFETLCISVFSDGNFYRIPTNKHYQISNIICEKCAVKLSKIIKRYSDE